MNKLKKMALRVIAESLSKEEIAGLTEMFIAMDADNSGAITFDELKEGLRKYGSTLKDIPKYMISWQQLMWTTAVLSIMGNSLLQLYISINWIERSIWRQHLHELPRMPHICLNLASASFLLFGFLSGCHDFIYSTHFW